MVTRFNDGGLLVVSQPVASPPSMIHDPSPPINNSPYLLLTAPAANAEYPVYSHHPAEAMASSGGAVAAMLKNKMLVACVMLLVVLLMATQMAAAAGDDGAARRRLLDACQYRNCNCRTCPIFHWACCGLCCPPA